MVRTGGICEKYLQETDATEVGGGGCISFSCMTVVVWGGYVLYTPIVTTSFMPLGRVAYYIPRSKLDTHEYDVVAE